LMPSKSTGSFASADPSGPLSARGAMTWLRTNVWSGSDRRRVHGP